MTEKKMTLSLDQQLDIARRLLPDLAPLIDQHLLPHLPASGGGREALTLEQALERMNEAKAHQAEATRLKRRNVFRALFARVPHLAKTPLQACTPRLIQKALDLRWGHSARGWNDGLVQIAALFNHARRRQWVRMENPAAALEPKHLEEAEIFAISPATLRELFKACEIHSYYAPLRAYIAICAFAGVRPTECRRLTWGDVNFEERCLTVRAANSKTGGTRHIELHPTLRAWLRHCRPEDARPDTPITPGHLLTHGLREMKKSIGFDSQQNPWQQDCLRHSYATYYLAAGGELSRLQLNMGHRSTQLLYTRYVNMRGVSRATAAEWWKILPNSNRKNLRMKKSMKENQKGGIDA